MITSCDAKNELVMTIIARCNEAKAELLRLSKRETEVACSIAEGLTNREIAEKYNISTKTVEKHRARAIIKLNAKNSAALVGLVVLAKLIPNKA